jgi:DNA-binding CsgD family transcriptional regulator
VHTSGARDRQALLEALRDIYAPRSLERFAAAALAAVGRVVDYEFGALHQIDVRRPAIETTVQHPENLVAPRDIPRFVHHLRDHPLLAHYARFPATGSRKISDCLTQREFHRTGLYAECYRPLGAEYQITFTLPPPPRSGVLHTVVLNRRRPDFSERERRLLDLLRPHVALAYRNAAAFDELQRRVRQLARAVDECDRGVAVVDPSGRMRMRTARARVLLDKYCGTAHTRHRLPEDVRDWARAWRAELDRHEGTRPPAEPLVIQRGAERLVVRLLPDWARGEHLLLMEEQRADLPAGLAASGLSRRESEVLSWVARGKTNAEAATILAISPRTVQKHLEHVFEKLGVETRTAAAATARDLLDDWRNVR